MVVFQQPKLCSNNDNAQSSSIRNDKLPGKWLLKTSLGNITSLFRILPQRCLPPGVRPKTDTDLAWPTLVAEHVMRKHMEIVEEEEDHIIN